MKNEIKHRKKIIIIGCILIILSSFHLTNGYSSLDHTFTLNLEKDELTLQTNDSITIKIFVNETSNISKNVTLNGEWIGTNKPKNISTSFSKTTGILPFISNITFCSSKSEIGEYKYIIRAENENITQNCIIRLNVIYDCRLNLKTDNNSYEKGEEININGNIITNSPSGKITVDNITITLQKEKWKRFSTIPIKNNCYNLTYNISYGDPEGIWSITATMFDNQTNILDRTRKVNVSLPSDVIRYKVLLLSPPEQAVYKRGDTFNISVFVSENDIGVKNATTICILPTMERIFLTEIKQGHYQQSYEIQSDSYTGLWHLSFESINDSGDNSIVGGCNTSIYVKSAKLKITLMEPSLNNYRSGEIIEIRVNLSYNNNTFVKNALVIADIFNEKIDLINHENGMYSINYTVTNDDIGRWFMTISASDDHGNNASITHVIQLIEEKQSIIPFTTIFILLFSIISIIIILFLLQKYFSQKNYKDITSEIKEIKRLQNEVAINYFRKGSISRKTYDGLMKEHMIRLSELSNEKSETKNED